MSPNPVLPNNLCPANDYEAWYHMINSLLNFVTASARLAACFSKVEDLSKKTCEDLGVEDFPWFLQILRDSPEYCNMEKLLIRYPSGIGDVPRTIYLRDQDMEELPSNQTSLEFSENYGKAPGSSNETFGNDPSSVEYLSTEELVSEAGSDCKNTEVCVKLEEEIAHLSADVACINQKMDLDTQEDIEEKVLAIQEIIYENLLSCFVISDARLKGEEEKHILPNVAKSLSNISESKPTTTKIESDNVQTLIKKHVVAKVNPCAKKAEAITDLTRSPGDTKRRISTSLDDSRSNPKTQSAHTNSGKIVPPIAQCKKAIVKPPNENPQSPNMKFSKRKAGEGLRKSNEPKEMTKNRTGRNEVQMESTINKPLRNKNYVSRPNSSASERGIELSNPRDAVAKLQVKGNVVRTRRDATETLKKACAVLESMKKVENLKRSVRKVKNVHF